jgi:hypothetical protein
MADVLVSDQLPARHNVKAKYAEPERDLRSPYRRRAVRDLLSTKCRL